MGHAPPDCSAREDLLDEILTGYIKAVETGRSPDRQEWLARHPDLAAELQAFFRDQDQLDRFAGPLRPAGRAARMTVGPGSLDDTVAQDFGPGSGIDARSFGEYELLQMIAEGGMGVVYKARHRKLQHLVALKVLLAGRFARPSDLQRFRNEAETIAALDHPNIVPVYEVGERDGRLYLSLRLLEGGTLSDHLSRYGGDPRAAAALVVTVARAVHHAHQRGVLHRDLKPSNILLDADSQPHVADFGLARRLEGDSGLTETGAILGTPSYMAPEQTVAGPRAVTTAADVYGLGGILYALLTGSPPFQGADAFDTMMQVRERTPESPSRRNPRVDRDLATICLKCLEKEPARRYASAQDLADDLGRFLRHEPTWARPAGRARRLTKWVRRRPALATLVAASGLFVVTLLAGVLVHNIQLREAVQKASDNEEAARRQQQLAADHYRQARDTINRMLGRLEGRGLADVPRLKELSQDQLEDALTFYQRTLEEQDNPDPGVRLDTAMAYRRAADIQQALGRLRDAADNYRRAIELLENLPAEHRDAPKSQRLLAGCYTNQASLAGGVNEAASDNRTALGIYERLAAANPADPVVRSGLAESEHNLGLVCLNARNPAEAEAHFGRAIALRTRLVHDDPDVPGYQAALAEDYMALALLCAANKRRDEAGAAYEKVEALLPPLIQKHPDKPEYSLSLAATYVNWSYFLKDTGRPQEALRILGQAADFTEAVLRQEPHHASARRQAFNAHGARAQLHEGLGRFADAVKDWDRVAELDDAPDRWRRRVLRAVALARAGEHARAAAEAEAWVAKPEVTADGLHELARACAIAAEAARADARLPAAERIELAEPLRLAGGRPAAQAEGARLLQGCTSRLAAVGRPGLETSRGRDDYRKLMAPAGGDKPE